jgi:hypothetical protein
MIWKDKQGEELRRKMIELKEQLKNEKIMLKKEMGKEKILRLKERLVDEKSRMREELERAKANALFIKGKKERMKELKKKIELEKAGKYIYI